MDLNIGIKNDLIDDDDLLNLKNVSFEESKRTNDNNIDYSNMSLNELVISLKGKLKNYETEIVKLIDDKLKMQMEINNLQLDSGKVKKLIENKTLIIQPKINSKSNIKITIEPTDKYKSSITGDKDNHNSTKFKTSSVSRKNMEKIYIQNLEKKLREETNKRKYYQKLCKILNKKIKKLYKTLLDNSIQISNISNIDDTKIRNELDINKIL